MSERRTKKIGSGNPKAGKPWLKLDGVAHAELLEEKRRVSPEEFKCWQRCARLQRFGI